MMSSGASPPSVPISTSVAVRDYLETREFRCVGDLPEYWVQESSEKQFAKHHNTMRGRVNWLALVRSDEAADTDQFDSPRHSRRVYPARPSGSLAHLGATDADRGIGPRDQERPRKAASDRALKLAVPLAAGPPICGELVGASLGGPVTGTEVSVPVAAEHPVNTEKIKSKPSASASPPHILRTLSDTPRRPQ